VFAGRPVPSGVAISAAVANLYVVRLGLYRDPLADFFGREVWDRHLWYLVGVEVAGSFASRAVHQVSLVSVFDVEIRYSEKSGNQIEILTIRRSVKMLSRDLALCSFLCDID